MVTAMKRISEGAEAFIYQTEYMGIPVVVKDRISKRYREPHLDRRIREQRTKSEARIISRASLSANAPRVLHMSGFKLYINYIDGRTLNTTEEIPMPLMREAGRQLALLHGIDISHGDYTPANLMVDRAGKLWVIDFGLSEITNSTESKALDLLLMKRSVGKAAYTAFIDGYIKGSGSGKALLLELAGIERRGRYQTRTIAEAKA